MRWVKTLSSGIESQNEIKLDISQELADALGCDSRTVFAVRRVKKDLFQTFFHSSGCVVFPTEDEAKLHIICELEKLIDKRKKVLK